MTSDISTLDFVAFDTETTGLYPSSEALVEVAAVRFNLVYGPMEYFQSLVNPGKSIPPMATRVHGITDEMVFTAPPAAEVLPQFFRFLEGAIPVAHHAPFDLGFLSLHGLRSGLALPETPVLDSCAFSRKANPEMPSHKLEALVKALGISAATFHRALADAKSCAELFRHCVQKTCGPYAPWDELVNAHGRPLSFGDSSSSASPVTAAQLPADLQKILTALEGRRSIWMQYEGSFGPREVTPHLVYAKGAQRYMEATCHLDGMRKSFRLDRIKAILENPYA